MITPSKLEQFSAGERFAVDPDAIERELAALWRAAGASTESRKPVTRACLWNLVAHVEERPGAEGQAYSEALARVIRELPRYIATRALVLKTAPEGSPGPELESWISANCILAGGGGKLVCSEEVAIAARGAGERHLPALVRALLVPGVPSAAVFAGVHPPDRPLADALVQIADRLVVRADHSTVREPLRRIREMMPEVALGAIDLGWLETSQHRALVAGLFDPPAPPEAPGELERVAIVTPPRLRWTAQLFAAWVASALGGREPRRVGELGWRFGRGARPALDLVIREDSGAAGPSVELGTSAHRALYAVRCTSETMAEITAPHVSTRKPLGKPNPAALLARALATRSEDQAFARALGLAGAM